MMLMKRQLKYRLLIIALTLFSLFENTLASEQVTSLCETAFNDQPGSSSPSSIIAQELLNYKILLYKISKLIQSESSNSTTIAALKGELSRRRGALLEIGVPSASMTLSPEDRVQLNKLERGELRLSQLIKSQQKKQTDALSNDLSTIFLRKRREFTTPFRVDSVEFSPDGSFYLIAGQSWDKGKQLKLYDAQTDNEIITLYSTYFSEAVPKFSSNGEYIAVSSASEFRMWNAKSREQIAAFNNISPIVSYSFSSDSKMMYMMDELGHITQMDVLTKAVKTTDRAQIQGDKVLAAYWPQKNDSVITFESDGNFHYYDINGKPFDQIKTNNNKMSVLHIRPKFSRDGRYAAIGSTKIFVYDLQKRKLIYTSKDSYLKFCNFTFDPSGRFLVVGNYGGRINIFDLQTGKKVQSLSKHKKDITQLNFSPNGLTFVSAGGDDPTFWEVDFDNDFKNLVDERAKQ